MLIKKEYVVRNFCCGDMKDALEEDLIRISSLGVWMGSRKGLSMSIAFCPFCGVEILHPGKKDTPDD